MSEKAWYRRSEFWSSLATSIIGILGAVKSNNPTVQNISATAAGMAPIVYSWGRNQVKKTRALVCEKCSGE